VSAVVGEKAPPFTLPAIVPMGEGFEKRDVGLDDVAGSPAVLVFYPADHSPVCTVQLQTYSHDIADFADVGAQVLAISPQDVEEHEGFASEHGLAFPLLADEGKKVGEAYGIPTPETLDAIRLAARLEGMITDPVYEGKSMAALIGLVQSGEIPRDAKVLYVHLGGAPAINAYSGLFR